MCEYLKQLSVLLDRLQSPGVNKSKPCFHLDFTYTTDIGVHILARLAELRRVPRSQSIADVDVDVDVWFATKTCVRQIQFQGMRVVTPLEPYHVIRPGN